MDEKDAKKSKIRSFFLQNWNIKSLEILMRFPNHEFLTVLRSHILVYWNNEQDEFYSKYK